MYLMYHFGFNFPRPPSRIFSMLVCQVRGETLVQPVSRSTDIVDLLSVHALGDEATAPENIV